MASAPFSAYSRGVQLASHGGFDFSLLVDSAGRQLVDISGALVNLVLAQGWLSFYNLVLTIAANAFYTYLGFAAVAAELDFTLVSFVVLLPLVLSTFHSLQRRNNALNDLSLGELTACQGYAGCRYTWLVSLVSNTCPYCCESLSHNTSMSRTSYTHIIPLTTSAGFSKDSHHSFELGARK